MTLLHTDARHLVTEALVAIARHTPPATVTRLTTDADPDVRWAAAWALRNQSGPEVIATLTRLTTDTTPDVREAAMDEVRVQLRGLASGHDLLVASDRATPGRPETDDGLSPPQSKTETSRPTLTHAGSQQGHEGVNEER